MCPPSKPLFAQPSGATGVVRQRFVEGTTRSPDWSGEACQWPQKTEVMVEHFNTMTRHKIGGRAKGMVVTGSRLEAVRYKQSFDSYIKEKGYPIKSLVAFSGTVQDDKIADLTYTEEGMNHGIRAKELPEKFATQDFQVLLVAEKYQTGFDQPLLHTMYLDKRLAGIQAVQTLSRLNRIHPLKEDTFVLDFVNDREEIRAAFKIYFEGAEMGEEVEPSRLYQIKGELDSTGVYLSEEVARFCEVYFKPKQKQSFLDHQAMNATLDPAVSRFTVRQRNDESEAEEWRGKLQAFRNLYGFSESSHPLSGLRPGTAVRISETSCSQATPSQDRRGISVR
jgi:type I restriction enzyme R subunit